MRTSQVIVYGAIFLLLIPPIRQFFWGLFKGILVAMGFIALTSRDSTGKSDPGHF